jgi:hypothetical protein
VAADECHGEENPSPDAAVIGTAAQLGARKSTPKAKRKKHVKKRGKSRHRRRKHQGREGHRNG